MYFRPRIPYLYRFTVSYKSNILTIVFQPDPYQPNWRYNFCGVNYPRLRSIKAKYDPKDLFYATTAVGSDEYEIDSRGALCVISA